MSAEEFSRYDSMKLFLHQIYAFAAERFEGFYNLI